MTLEEKKRALEHYFARQMRYMKHFENNSTKIVFLGHCFGAIDLMVELSPVHEQKELEDLWDEWKPRLEVEAYGF